MPAHSLPRSIVSPFPTDWVGKDFAIFRKNASAGAAFVRKIAAAREREAGVGGRGPGEAGGNTKPGGIGGGIYYDPERAKAAAAKAREASDDGRGGGKRKRPAGEKKKPRKRDRERG